MPSAHTSLCKGSNDGRRTSDGIIETVDEHYLYLAVPTGDADGDEMRAFTPFGYPGYGYPGYYPGYVYPRRRFHRLILPLAALLALSLLPYY